MTPQTLTAVPMPLDALQNADLCAHRQLWHADKPCHHLLYAGGAFVRLYPVNPRSTRNRAAKTKRRPHVRYTFGLDMWGLASVTDSRLKSPRMSTQSWHGLMSGSLTPQRHRFKL